jgi:hypothetical protein
MASKFKVHVVRAAYAHNVFVVEASNEQEAGEKALELAKSFAFKESDSEFTIIDINGGTNA